jgi:hypothetical protein
LLLVASCLLPPVPSAGEVVFLEDGRTIHAERVEVMGNRVRIFKPAETIDVPKAAVRSIHQLSPPAGVARPSPAEVYRDLPQQMDTKIRQEIKRGRDGSAAR